MGDKVPVWSSIALALPLLGALAGYLCAGPYKGPGNWGGGIAGVVLAGLALVVAATLGLGAGLISLFKGERREWLTVVALLINVAIILPIANFVISGPSN